MTGYDRSQFGEAWTDDNNDQWGRNGCDSRDDLLAHELTNVVFESGSTCDVATGDLPYEPYTGQPVHYVRSGDYANGLDVDHILPLGLAWQEGAQHWTVQKRTDFANDPLVLVLADPSENRKKGDGDAATWLPKNRAIWAAYAARIVAVHLKYGLWVTAPEKAALARLLSANPTLPLGSAGVLVPAGSNTKIGDPPASTRTPSPKPLPTDTQGPTTGSSSVIYANCDAVRAAGKAPIHRGDPGYSSRLDRDGDGVGCE